MKKRKKTIIWMIVLLVLLGGVLFGLHEVTTSANGSISQPNLAKPVDHSQQTTTVDNTYAQFKYPADYSPRNSATSVAPVLLRYNYLSKQFVSTEIAIQISKLASGSLSDDGSYNYRSVTGIRFREVNKTVGANKVIIFTDLTEPGFSKVAYLQSGDTDASISISSAAGSQANQMQAILEAVIASWQWH